jgi:DNA-binding SARP family transcriptional activator
LYERERLQNMYLMMLDRLVSDCEQQRDLRTGLVYGERLLRVDHAHERTHRRVMRMLYLQGDRTAALRQYDRCVNALRQELGVEPSERTRELHREIAADHVVQTPHLPTTEPALNALPLLPSMLERLKHFHALLNSTQLQVEREIQAVEQALGRRV